MRNAHELLRVDVERVAQIADLVRENEILSAWNALHGT